MLGPPPIITMRSACKVLWRVVLEEGALGQRQVRVMAEKVGGARYLGPQNLPSAWSLPS